MKKMFAILMCCSFAVFAEQININQADAETISKALKGIGPKKAEAIIQYRNEHGDFKTLQDLEKVKGIGEKTAKQNEKDILFVAKDAVEAADNKESAATPSSVK